jgi:hypothetical protein
MPDQNDESIWGQAPPNLEVKIKHPRPQPSADESLEFHSSRLLFLLYYAGGRNKEIEGRTKLAKMDFLIRYPTYLIEAAKILNEQKRDKSSWKEVKPTIKPVARPESRMIRFKYGPWDAKYYDIFSYLIAKDFIEIEPSKSKGDIFKLTVKGRAAVEELEGSEFEDIIERCKLVYRLFGTSAGNTIKLFIYNYFTNILEKPLGAEIEGEDAK